MAIAAQTDNHVIIGIGTDLVKIERIKAIIERYNSFVSKIYTHKEIEYCSKKKNQFQHYAARFAAKEALFKAMGTGWDVQINWLNISVENDLGGKPKIQLYGKAKELSQKLCVRQIHLSLTHTRNFAAAFVVLES